MNISKSTILDYIANDNKRFIIPVYQRSYNWKETQCRQLFDDLMKVIKNNRTKHFFGSIVSVFAKNGGKYEYTIIDGQQRVTTVSLLILALHKLLKENKIGSDDSNLVDKLLNNYLIDRYNDEIIIKLNLVKNDQKAYDRLFEDEIDYIKSSNITVNYEYFYKRVQDENLSADNVMRALSSLEIIDINLDQKDDNPQLIFESLNSTGLELSEGDKIRNYILMQLPAQKQNIFYEKYWSKIEENTKTGGGQNQNKDHVDDFIKNYLSVKQRNTPVESKIYVTFKDYVEANSDKENFDTESLLIDMLKYSRFYNILAAAKHEDKRLSSCILRLNRLQTTVTRPFFLEVLRLHSDNKLTIDDVLNIFLTIEIYIFRRIICEFPTNALNKMFVSLHNEIMKYDGTSGNYINKLKYALLNKKDRTVFPRDKDFAEAFVNKEIYSRSNTNKLLYALERLENSGTLESKNIYNNFDDNVYTIEHIMPQTLTPEWTKSLGDDYKRVYDTWINKIANLTLTAYNAKYGNRPFIEKRDMKDGFRESGFKINQGLARLDKWGENELKQRNETLKKRALEIWPLPKTNFRPDKKQFEEYRLDDENDLTGKILKKFSYNNIEYNAANWQDMFEQVVKTLHSEDRTILYRLADDESYNYASRVPERLRECFKIDDGLYIEKNTSTKYKLSILKKLFKDFQCDPSDLVFYIDIKR